MEIVRRWCNRWNLKINAEKCSVVHFRKKSVRKSSVEFRIGGEIPSRVSEYKYLEIVLNEFLKSEKNGRKALYGVMRLVRDLGRSTILYGCEIGGV